MNNLETLDLNGDILHMPGYQVNFRNVMIPIRSAQIVM